MTGGETVLLTACIAPGSEVPYLALRDVGERLADYMESLVRWLRTPAVSAVVFCDNSGYSFESESFAALARALGKELEVLCFSGNDGAERYGKGYGEGRLCDYAFSKSHLLRQATSFYKVTGRLYVTNFDRIALRHSRNESVFALTSSRVSYAVKRFRGKPEPRGVDTRLFKIGADLYRRRLFGCYHEVDDCAGRALEHVVHDRLVSEPVAPFLECPRYAGRSGTTGKPFSGRWTDHVLRDLWFRLGLHAVSPRHGRRGVI